MAQDPLHHHMRRQLFFLRFQYFHLNCRSVLYQTRSDTFVPLVIFLFERFKHLLMRSVAKRTIVRRTQTIGLFMEVEVLVTDTLRMHIFNAAAQLIVDWVFFPLAEGLVVWFSLRVLSLQLLDLLFSVDR